jgi:hypothetical protein
MPPPVFDLGPLHIGVGGGFYLRVLPLWVQRRALERYVHDGAPFLMYLHPREFDPDSWNLRLPLSTKEQFIHRVGLRTVRSKITRLLAGRQWQPLGEILRRRGLLA